MPFKDPEKIRGHHARLRTRRQTDIRQWASRLVSNIPARSRRLNVPFDLDVEDLLQLVPEDRRCPVFDYEMTFGGKRSRRSMSLDRIDPAGGYTKDNCRVMSLRANALKSNATFDELQKVVDFMRKTDAPNALHRRASESRFDAAGGDPSPELSLPC